MTLQTIAIFSPLAIVVIAIAVVVIGNLQLKRQKQAEQTQIAEMEKIRRQSEDHNQGQPENQGKPGEQQGRWVMGEPPPIGVVRLPQIEQSIDALQEDLNRLRQTLIDVTSAESKPST
ncbi:hypothetical protein [Bradyrhizobium sp. SYSU BS000235]|uniref:hypothetical protein n=1 Tax=Bradyrhizobium sp. SYSU BS000235 TaxID=3411332 RepID=UPI003C78861E